MQEEGRKLLKLQGIYSRIDRLKEREATLPERQKLEETEAKLAEEEKERAVVDAQYDGESSKQKKMEGELELLNIKKKKEEGKLYSGTIGSTKELESIQEELKMLKRQIDEKETELLTQIEVTEQLSGRVEALDEERARDRQEIESVEAEMDRALAEIADEQAKLEADRVQAMEEVEDEGLLQEYEALRKRKGGVGAAAIIEGICQGCRMELPAEEVDKLLHSEELWECPSCGRILVKEHATGAEPAEEAKEEGKKED